MQQESRYHPIYETQKEFFDSGASQSYNFRRKQLKNLKKAVKTYEEEIAAALYSDLHKSAAEALLTEIGFVYKEINYAKKHLKQWMKPQKVKSPAVTKPSSSRIYREPKGLTLIIAPWNYPFQLLINPLVGAIAGGNCAILKPSEEVPQTANVIAAMIKKFFPENYITVVQGPGHEVVPELLHNFSFGHIFFTGSVPVGKSIMAAASNHLSPVTLELGGKSPCIIDKSADIEKAAKRITWGKFVNAGQTCVAPDYILIHSSVKKEFLEKVALYLKEFYGKDPLKSPDYPRMVNKKRFQAVAKYLDKGRIILGGDVKEEEMFIAPTLIEDVSLQDPIMQEEIFGPVLPILTFNNLSEVPEIVAKNPHPLALYLFSKNNKNQKFILQKIRFGGGCINDVLMHLANPSIPFGGIGTSGWGAYHGKFSFDTFTHAKGVIKSSTRIDIPLRYPPFSKTKKKFLKMFFR